MTRLIPGKTNVQIELFRGVTLWDILIGGVGLTMMILVIISSLPYKLGICIAVGAIGGLLLVRVDAQANYLYIMHILSHFGYDRRFARRRTDKALLERGANRAETDDADAPSRRPPQKRETRSERKRRLKAERREEKERRLEEKERERERKRERKREDRILKSKRHTEEEKEQIRMKRAEEESARIAEAEAKAEQQAREAEAQAERKAREAASRRAKKLSRKERKAAKKERKAAAKEKKIAEKARVKARKDEDRRLKSPDVPEEEKEEIRARRAAASAEAMRKMAEAKDAAAKRLSMDEIVGFTDIRDGVIVYGKNVYYGAVLEIDPVEFRFFSEHRRQNSIETGLGRVLRGVNAKYSANIIKLERPIQYESYLDKEYDKLYRIRSSYESGMLTEEELKARVEVEYDRINELLSLCNDQKVVTAFYYLALYESDRRQLELEAGNALTSLGQGEMTARRLNDKELAVFLKYSNGLDFDEREIDRIAPEDYAQWAKPEVVDIKARRVEINHVITHNFRVVNYPSRVGDAWIAGVMSLPGTKVIVKARPMDRTKAIRNIDRSLMELRGQLNLTSVDSRRLEIEEHLETLQELLGELQSDNESLMDCNIYITAYDITATMNNFRIKHPESSALPTIADMKKTVRRAWRESGFRLGNMEFEQVQAFLGAQVNGLDPLSSKGRGIPSNTVAACYPWIYAHISDEGGVKLGESDGIPVFINFFRRDSERVNSNMVIVGKSGSGKSYATKSILSNLAADDAKIFILDPENEYTELAGNLHGKIINVGNAQYGRLNPFHIITALEDDEAGTDSAGGSYATHLQFLEEFFRQILPDCDKDSMEYLNSMVDRLYADFNITPETDLSQLTPADYPIFDDLYDAILQEFQSTDNQYIRTMLRTLMNYVAKFSTGGRNANIWNGPSTVTTDTNFTVFNFQSMLANRNAMIANAQMLLVLKYIDNEIIKNRDYNAKYRLNRKVVVVIDEAHVFIDTKFPIALDFMFQLAKRIRKYNGMQIVITQNIKDFVGSEEIARKSTAIINACQYSFIFALAPNDIQDLVQLYANAGGINENEQEQILQAPRGQAFTIMSAKSRSTFQVETGESMIAMFEEPRFVSRYFTGEEGAAAWEDFVAGSRAAHNRTVREQDAGETAVIAEKAAPRKAALFEEISEEEYEQLTSSGGVTFEETEEEAPLTPAALEPVAESAKPSSPVEQLAAALTESLQRAGLSGGQAPSGDYNAMVTEVRRTVSEQLGAERAELRREREELREMMRRLQTMTADASGSAGISRETAESVVGETPAFGGGEAAPDTWDAPESAVEETSAFADEAEAAADTWDAPESDAVETSAFADEEEAAESVTDEDEDEDNGAFSFDEDQDEDEDDGLDLAAFLNQSVREAASMDMVDRLRQEGKTVMPITLEDLTEYLEKWR